MAPTGVEELGLGVGSFADGTPVKEVLEAGMVREKTASRELLKPPRGCVRVAPPVALSAVNEISNHESKKHTFRLSSDTRSAVPDTALMYYSNDRPT